MRARVALVGAATIVSVGWLATPAIASDGYPVERPSGSVQTTTDASNVRGGVEGTSSGSLPRTGGSLDPLWGGLGLLAAGGALVVVTRRRSSSKA